MIEKRPDVPLRKRTQKDVQAYSDLLVQRNRYEQWQLEQINDAMRLFFSEYLSLSWAKPWPVHVLQADPKAGILKKVDGYKKTNKFRDVPNWDGLEMRSPGLQDRIRKNLRTLHYRANIS